MRVFFQATKLITICITCRTNTSHVSRVLAPNRIASALWEKVVYRYSISMLLWSMRFIRPLDMNRQCTLISVPIALLCVVVSETIEGVFTSGTSNSPSPNRPP